MEKRLFLAVFLSLVVVFVFQSFLSPKKNASQSTPAQQVTTANVEKQTSAGIAEKPVVTEPVPSFEEKSTLVENSEFQIRFSNKGGDIDAIQLKKFNHQLPAKNIASIDLFQGERFVLDENGRGNVKYSFKNAEWQINKEYMIKNDYVILDKIIVKNLSTSSKNLVAKDSNFTINIPRLDKSNVQSDWSLCEYSIKTKKNFIRKDNIKVLESKLRVAADFSLTSRHVLCIL